MRSEGCQTYTPLRRPKLHGPGATGSRHRASWWQRRNSVPTGKALSRPKAVGRPRSTPQGGRGPENSAHRGSCGASLKTPRAGRRRKTDLRFQDKDGGPAGFAVPLRCREMPKPVGPSDPRRSARPRTFLEAHRPKASGECAPRERWSTSSSFRGARHKCVYARLRRAMASEPGIQTQTLSKLLIPDRRLQRPE
jgi:hypothetical protein